MAVEKTGDVCPSMGVTDGLLEIDVKSFYVFYTHSMIDVSERRIMYRTYSQVRFVPRQVCFCYRCVTGCYAHTGLIQPHNRLHLPTGYMSDVAILSYGGSMPSLSIETQR